MYTTFKAEKAQSSYVGSQDIGVLLELQAVTPGAVKKECQKQKFFFVGADAM